MPIHDWTQVDAGTFHNFHQMWTVQISARLNAGFLPKGHFAMVEQRTGGPEPDVVTLRKEGADRPKNDGGTLTLPKTRFVERAENVRYARKANRIAIHHRLGNVVAVIEVVSPGNKSSRDALRQFVRKSAQQIRQGIHLLIVDLFPPSVRDPKGIHVAVWSAITTSEFEPTPEEPLTFVSYESSVAPAAYVETAAVGQRMPSMPLFLAEEFHVDVPLEETYQTTWNALPVEIMELFGEAT